MSNSGIRKADSARFKASAANFSWPANFARPLSDVLKGARCDDRRHGRRRPKSDWIAAEVTFCLDRADESASAIRCSNRGCRGDYRNFGLPRYSPTICPFTPQTGRFSLTTGVPSVAVEIEFRPTTLNSRATGYYFQK